METKMRGSEVYDKISRKLTEKEGEFTSASNNLTQTESQLMGHNQERERLFVELASHYLPELVDERVLTAVNSVNGTLSQILQDKKVRVDFLEEQLENISGRRIILEERIKTLSGEIDTKSETYREKKEEAEKRLSENPKYARLTSQARETETLVSRLQSLKGGAEKEATDKLPAFDSDPIFAYLLNRKFGEPEYQRNFLTGFLDSLAAEAIDFDNAKTSYKHLKEYAPALAERTEREKAGLDPMVREINGLENEAYEATGALNLRNELSGLSERRSSLMNDNTRFGREYDNLHSELDELRKNQGVYYTKAIEVIKNTLGAETEETLLERARKTPSPEDDVIVSRVIELNHLIAKQEEVSKNQNSESRRLKDEVEKIRKLKKTFEQNSWHNSSSRFDSGFDVNTLLVGYLIGRASLRDVTSKIDSSQHFESYSSYSSSPSYSSGSSGGGFSSGGGGFGGSGGVGGGF